MPGQRRTPDQRQQDAERIARLHLEGRPQTEIAVVVGVSQQSVSLELARLRAAWRERAAGDYETKQAEALARIANLERHAWEAWEQSTGERTRSRTRRLERPGRSQVVKHEDGAVELVPTPPQVVTEATLDRTERDGNPAYLQQIAWCIAERSKVLGLYAPVKVAPTNPRGDRPYLPIEAMQRGTVLMDEVDEILERLARAERGELPPGQS